jgi:hypothetical protein
MNRDQLPPAPILTPIPDDGAAIVEVREGVFIQFIVAAGRDTPFTVMPAPPHKAADFMGCLLKEGDGDWQFRTRIRFAVDTDPWSKNDVKVVRYFSLPGKLSPELAELACELVLMAIRGNFTDYYHHQPVALDGGTHHDEIMALVAAQPWAHMKKVPLGSAEADAILNSHRASKKEDGGLPR